MKKVVLGLAMAAALISGPAMARSDTHVSIGFGFYSPAPVYYEPAPVVYRPAPVVYYPPVQRVYYAPPPCHDRRVAWSRGHHRGWEGGYRTAWNDDRYDRGDRWRGRY